MVSLACSPKSGAGNGLLEMRKLSLSACDCFECNINPTKQQEQLKKYNLQCLLLREMAIASRFEMHDDAVCCRLTASRQTNNYQMACGTRTSYLDMIYR